MRSPAISLPLFLSLLLFSFILLHPARAEEDVEEFDDAIKKDNPKSWADLVAGKVKPPAPEVPDTPDVPPAGAAAGAKKSARSLFSSYDDFDLLDRRDLSELTPRDAAALAIADAEADPEGFSYHPAEALERRSFDAEGHESGVLVARDDARCGTQRSRFSPFRTSCHTNQCRRHSSCAWRGTRCGGRNMRGINAVFACLGCSCRAW